MKRNLIAKFTTLATACVALFSVMTGTAPMGVYADSSTDNHHDTISETEAMTEMLNEFGFSSLNDFAEQSLRSFNPYNYISSIHDMNGDHSITALDAQLVLNYVKGHNPYEYDYQCLDVDGNLVVNEADVSIYLQFAIYALVHPELNNTGFSLGSGLAPSSATESRTYVKHDFSTGSAPSTTDVVYTINSNGTITYESNPWLDPNFHPTDYTINDNNIQTENFRTSPFTRVQDTRVVRCSGTGFIIGEHTIITNAHCVYGSGGYNISSDVCAFTFNSNNEPVRHDLTVVSYYVPMAYIDPSYSDIDLNLTDDLIHAYHDYAIIVVSEDLTSYGKFECGIPLESLANSTITSNTVSYGFPQDGTVLPDGTFVNGVCQVKEEGVIYRKYTVSSSGGVDSFARGYWIKTTSTQASKTGMSGAPIVLNSVVINNNTITCDETVIGISRSGPSSRGCSIVRPILQFIYGNEILDDQVDIL